METDKIPKEVPIAQAPLENEQIHKNFLNQKGNFLLILGTIVIILVVLGVGGLFLIRSNNINVPSSQTVNQSTTIQPSVTSQADNYKDWRVNETNGYQIKVPPGWSIYISSRKKELSQTLTEHVEKRSKNSQILFRKETTIGSRKAIITEASYTGGHELAGVIDIDKDFVFLVNGNKEGYFDGIKNLQGSTQKYNQTDYQNFEQILNTLQVRDLLTIEPEDKWNTYIDQDKTFSIKYPSIFNETKNTYTNSTTLKSSGALTTMQPYNGGGGPKDIAIQFTIIPKKPTESLKQFVNRIANERAGEFTPGNVDSDLKKAITVGGQTALWYEGSLGPAVIHDEIFILKDESTVIQIMIYTGEGGTSDPYKKEHIMLIESMLLTFKFSN